MPKGIRDLDDANFGTLNSTKNKFLVTYNSGQDEFNIISADSILSRSVDDADLPDDFVNRLNVEIDPNKITFSGLDGGTF